MIASRIPSRATACCTVVIGVDARRIGLLAAFIRWPVKTGSRVTSRTIASAALETPAVPELSPAAATVASRDEILRRGPDSQVIDSAGFRFVVRRYDSWRAAERAGRALRVCRQGTIDAAAACREARVGRRGDLNEAPAASPAMAPVRQAGQRIVVWLRPDVSRRVDSIGSVVRHSISRCTQHRCVPLLRRLTAPTLRIVPASRSA